MMGIQHEESIPASFADASSSTYLGNPSVVNELVGRFLSNVEVEFISLMGGESEKTDFTDALSALIRSNADIFSGRDASYRGIVGYHGQTLGHKLMADLGDFWRKRREAWGDDPLCVFFEWLAVTLCNHAKTADGDDIVLGVLMGPTVEYAVGVLLGTEKRAV